MPKLLLSVAKAMLTASVVLAVSSCGNPGPGVAQNSGPLSSSQTLVRGTVASMSPTQVTISTSDGEVPVRLKQPFQVYERGQSDLSRVRESSFVGVTSVKQPDGREMATEIHIFPEELRGLGEGSHMMSPPANTTPSRMTNGKVSTTASRMSNGEVRQKGGSTIEVDYQGGSQQIEVPANVPVTEIKPSDAKLNVGDNVVVVAEKDSAGSLASSKALLAGK